MIGKDATETPFVRSCLLTLEERVEPDPEQTCTEQDSSKLAPWDYADPTFERCGTIANDDQATTKKAHSKACQDQLDPVQTIVDVAHMYGQIVPNIWLAI
ncbi:MAG: hypothetical protein AAGA37_13785 [Actinomycetota bacterium]